MRCTFRPKLPCTSRRALLVLSTQDSLRTQQRKEREKRTQEAMEVFNAVDAKAGIVISECYVPSLVPSIAARAIATGIKVQGCWKKSHIRFSLLFSPHWISH